MRHVTRAGRSGAGNASPCECRTTFDKGDDDEDVCLELRHAGARDRAPAGMCGSGRLTHINVVNRGTIGAP
jgi:hypothetical protein